MLQQLYDPTFWVAVKELLLPFFICTAALWVILVIIVMLTTKDPHRKYKNHETKHNNRLDDWANDEFNELLAMDPQSSTSHINNQTSTNIVSSQTDRPSTRYIAHRNYY